MLSVRAAVMLISIWDLTSYLVAQKQFSQSEGFLNPLNAYHSNIAAVWNGHLDNGRSGNKLINKTRGREEKKKKERMYTIAEHKEFSERRVINWIV